MGEINGWKQILHTLSLHHGARITAVRSGPIPPTLLPQEGQRGQKRYRTGRLKRPLNSVFALIKGCFRGAPSVGFEPTQPAPEAGALSPELRGLARPL